MHKFVQVIFYKGWNTFKCSFFLFNFIFYW